MKVKISVILPVYNVELYLEECLDSLLNQTFNNFEVIAVNDGSTDKSLEILLNYKNKFDNIKIIDKDNKGLSDARNKGIINANGEYIIFLDSDDKLKENTLETLYNIAYTNNLDMVTYDCIQIDEISNKIDNKKYSRKKVYNKTILTKEEYFYGAIKKGMPQAPFHLYKKEFIDRNNLTFKEGILHEDELFSMNCYQYIDRVGYCNEQLYIRRFRANSIMSNKLYENIKSLNSYKYVLYEFTKLRTLNKKNEPFIKFLNARGTMLMCNLLRYKDFRIQDLYISRKEYGFKLDIIRIIYNLYNFRKNEKIFRGSNV